MAMFLILEPDSPRSIRLFIARTYGASSAIRDEIDPKLIHPAEFRFGCLKAQLNDVVASEIAKQRVSNYPRAIQGDDH